MKSDILALICEADCKLKLEWRLVDRKLYHMHHRLSFMNFYALNLVKNFENRLRVDSC